MPSVQYPYAQIIISWVIFFCSLRIYFPTSFSFAWFSHCFFFVFFLDLLSCTLSLYIFFSCLTFYYLCVSSLFSPPLFSPLLCRLFISVLFLCIFVSSPVSIFSLRVYVFCRGFSFLFRTHFLYSYLFLFVFSLACSISLFLSSLPIICSVFQYSFLLARCYADQLDTYKISCCKDCSRNTVGSLTTYLVIRCIPSPRCVPKSLITPFPSASRRLCPVCLPCYFMMCWRFSTCAFARTHTPTHTSDSPTVGGFHTPCPPSSLSDFLEYATAVISAVRLWSFSISHDTISRVLYMQY